MKSILTAFITLIVPVNFIKIFLLKLLGHKVSYASKIRMSFIKTNSLILEKNACIGMLNYINNNTVTLKEQAFIKHLNFIKGPFDVLIKEKGSMTNQNKIRRSNSPITYGISKFEIGENTQIVSNQFIDLTRSVILGNNSQIAGIGTQIWTHGYVHFSEKEKRVRVDGKVMIGNNVYIGSRCTFNAGVKVANNITIGSNSTISKDLTEEGLYVNQPLRIIKKEEKLNLYQLKKITDFDLIEEVYEKK